VLLSVRSLTRRFGTRTAVSGVDLDVRTGESVAVFGGNGAGKSTLLRLLSGTIRASSGTIAIAGEPPRSPAARSRIGVVAHQTLLYDDLTAIENLVFFGRLHGVADPEGRARALLDRLGLASRAGDPVRSFSRGMQHRVSLARALVHAPPLLLLDEPGTGLDAASRRRFHEALAQASASGTTWVIVTHTVEEGLSLCPRWIFLRNGAVADAGTGRAEDVLRLQERMAEVS
jgi:heme exporter protein A